MMRVPDQEVVRAAELRVIIARQRTVDEVRRVRAGLKAQMARPSTLAAAAAIGGVAGFLMARKPRGASEGERDGKAETGKHSAMAIALAFAGRYAASFAMNYLTRQLAAKSAVRDGRQAGAYI
jgi:hypothetical protein